MGETSVTEEDIAAMSTEEEGLVVDTAGSKFVAGQGIEDLESRSRERRGDEASERLWRTRFWQREISSCQRDDSGIVPGGMKERNTRKM